MTAFWKMICLLPLIAVSVSVQAGVWDVKKNTGLSEIKQAVEMAQDYDTLYIHEGVYLESRIEIHKPLSLIGLNRPVIESEGGDEIFVVYADDVKISGMVLKNIGVSYIEDRAAIKLHQVKNALIEDNQLVNSFFGIYLKNATDCMVRNNVVKGEAEDEVRAGNAIHVWKSDRIEIIGNEVMNHRDGIYLEFVN